MCWFLGISFALNLHVLASFILRSLVRQGVFLVGLMVEKGGF